MRAFLDRLRPLAPLTLRIALAVIFVFYGYSHLFKGMADFTKIVTGFGFPVWMAKLAAWSELVGGLLLGVGFLTRLGALACAAVVAVAIVKLKLHAGFDQGSGIEYPLVCLAGCLSLVLSGAGRLSVDRRLFGGA